MSKLRQVLFDRYGHGPVSELQEVLHAKASQEMNLGHTARKHGFEVKASPTLQDAYHLYQSVPPMPELNSGDILEFFKSIIPHVKRSTGELQDLVKSKDPKVSQRAKNLSIEIRNSLKALTSQVKEVEELAE